MDQYFSNLDIVFGVVALAAGMVVSWQTGKLMGRRVRNQGYTEPSKFDDAGMAFLGLLIAFTFGMSIERYNQRQVVAVSHSNAISDLYFSAGMLKEPIRTRLQSLVRQYAQLILKVTDGPLTEADIDNALARSEQMHAQMADVVRQAVDEGTPIADSLNSELNTMIDSQASRLAAFRARVPGIIQLLLFASAIVTTLLIGREQGVADVHEVAGTICFVLLVSMAIYVTLDLNSPNRGFIHINHESLERLVASMSK